MNEIFKVGDRVQIVGASLFSGRLGTIIETDSGESFSGARVKVDDFHGSMVKGTWFWANELEKVYKPIRGDFRDLWVGHFPEMPVIPERPWLSKMQGHIDEWWLARSAESVADSILAYFDLIDSDIFGKEGPKCKNE